MEQMISPHEQTKAGGYEIIDEIKKLFQVIDSDTTPSEWKSSITSSIFIKRSRKKYRKP